MRVEYDRSEFRFATIIGRTLEEKLKGKEDAARKIRGSITLECRDLEKRATVFFEGDRVVVRDGGGGESLISADFQTLNALTFGRVGMLGILKLILSGRLKINGMLFAMKFRKLLN